ncbi:hypothetical protein PV797_06960 [Clostridiaceae bacterium M8S5]|nr:hypothetical protein PV797_06960 [Clostridiaceae bacterium M8S5]
MKCSGCSYEINNESYAFCPKCGVRLDGNLSKEVVRNSNDKYKYRINSVYCKVNNRETERNNNGAINLISIGSFFKILWVVVAFIVLMISKIGNGNRNSK